MKSEHKPEENDETKNIDKGSGLKSEWERDLKGYGLKRDEGEG